MSEIVRATLRLRWTFFEQCRIRAVVAVMFIDAYVNDFRDAVAFQETVLEGV